ncbi:Sec-independent protein translocase subunit TatB [Streptomyces sp. NPDC014734]|uniref:Sec-independent protein translocase subunit TatB n=1 Tax=Streptomyces sp. NPDC014734 TaxID=3364886 RepID=UPI0036F67DEE
MFSDVGPLELITIAVLGMLLFGPDKLPELIRNAADLAARFRQFSEHAKQEIRSELGPDFQDFEFEDLHPKTLVRKHVLSGDGLGLDEIRDALDPRKELAEAAEAVRGTTGSESGSGSDATGSGSAGRGNGAADELPDGPAPTGGTPSRVPLGKDRVSFAKDRVSFEKGGDESTHLRVPFDTEAT